jgi:hypothetical protein
VSTVLFIHLYKTGGSAVFQLLRDYAALNQVPFLDYTTWIRSWRGLSTGGGELELTQEEQEYLRKFQIIGGHMWYGKHRYLAEHTYVTMLRKPSATAVSEILYKSRSAGGAKHSRNLGEAVAEIQAYLDCRPREYRCDMIDRLVGERLSAPLPDRLAIAQDHLSRIHIVGLLESLTTSLDLISRCLPLCSREQIHSIYQQCARNAIPYGYTSQQVIASLSPAYLAELERFVTYEHELYVSAECWHRSQAREITEWSGSS